MREENPAYGMARLYKLRGAPRELFASDEKQRDTVYLIVKGALCKSGIPIEQETILEIEYDRNQW